MDKHCTFRILTSSDGKERGIYPVCGTSNSCGYDLACPQDVKISAEETEKIGIGVRTNILPGYMGLIKERSSIAAQMVIVLGGIIDEDYKGELFVLLHNLTKDVSFSKGDRVAQIIFLKYDDRRNFLEDADMEMRKYADCLFDVKTCWPKQAKVIQPKGSKKKPKRGMGGFGSTGK